MIGNVDNQGRALLHISVGRRAVSNLSAVIVWIDTAFDGHLVFSQALIDELALDDLAESEATLADGSKVTLQTYICFIDWYGSRRPVHVIANQGKFPLLGTGLLDQRILHIDYQQKSLSLD